MTYLNFHAHRPAADDDEHVLQDGKDTWGIHPWTVSRTSFPCPLNAEQRAALLAIGECGLDSVCDTPLDLQSEAFRYCIELSEELGKPLFLHCVRQMGPCIQLRRQMGATQPWVWHGFRGSAARLGQLLDMGFYFSFGFQHREEALLNCPAHRLLLETDTDPRPIRLLYQHTAQLRGITTERLCAQMQTNWQQLFG